MAALYRQLGRGLAGVYCFFYLSARNTSRTGAHSAEEKIEVAERCDTAERGERVAKILQSFLAETVWRARVRARTLLT